MPQPPQTFALATQGTAMQPSSAISPQPLQPALDKEQQRTDHQQQQQQASAVPYSPVSIGSRFVQPPTTRAIQQSVADLKQNFYNPYHVKHRRRTTKEQLLILESTFKTSPKPSSDVRKSLAGQLGMSAREVQIWFQNRRAKQKNMILRATASSVRASAESSTSPLTINTSVASSMSNLMTPTKLQRSASVDVVQPSSASTPPIGGAASATSAVAAAAAIKDLPAHVPRRHSDLPASFMLSEASAQRAVSSSSAGVGASPDKMSPAAASATATAASATAAPAKFPPPPPLVCSTAAQMHHPALPPPLLTMPQPLGSQPAYHHQQQLNASAVRMQRKQKRGGGGSGVGADSGRYDTARVHQEAFDGTNKLPLKPDDLSPTTADEQFSLLDPSNLPTFMMPGSSSTGGVSSMVGYGGGPAMVSSFSMPVYGGSSSVMRTSMPFAGGMQNSVTPTIPQMGGGVSALFSGLLGLSPSPYGDLSLGALGLSGTGLGSPDPASVHPSLSPTDLPFGVDATTSFYHTLFLLGQQSLHGAEPAAGMGRSSSKQHGAEKLASTSSAAASSVASQSMLPPPAIPGSAFSAYDSQQQGQSKQQAPQATAMFIPTSSSPPPFPQMVDATAAAPNVLGSADLFGSAGGSANLLYSAGTHQSTPSGPASPPY